MINMFTVVGRVASDPELKISDNDKKYCNITLAVQKSYKNKDGNYDTDFINFTVWENQAENFCQYNKKGDIVGVKGSLETYKDENDKTRLTLKTERMTFLGLQKNKEMEER